MFKQTLKSAGGNLTKRHIEEVSLSVLFLLEAAKSTDRAFGAVPQTTAHSIRDPTSDLSKLVKHLMETKVSQVDEDRQGPAFHDSTDDGYKKLCSSWLSETLLRSHVSAYNNPPSEADDGDITDEYLQRREEYYSDDIDIDYELSDVL